MKTSIRSLIYLSCALLCAVSLVACGKVGPPTAPGGEEQTYPKTYPTY